MFDFDREDGNITYKKRAADLNWAKEERGEVRRIRVREAECDV